MEIIVRKIFLTYFFSENLVYLLIYLFISVIFEFEIVFFLHYLTHILWAAVLCTVKKFIILIVVEKYKVVAIAAKKNII